MTLSLEGKKRIVEEVSGLAHRTSSIIAAEYKGLSVADMTVLRRTTREAGVCLKIVRNTLARRAFEGSEFAFLSTRLTGPLLLAFGSDNPASAARIIRDFSKENACLKVRLIAFEGKLLEPSELDSLASMPSLDEARAMFLGLLQAPHSRFVGTLAKVPEGVVRLLVARRDQQGD